MIGKVFKFKINVADGKYTQVGVGNPYTEIWTRPKKQQRSSDNNTIHTEPRAARLLCASIAARLYSSLSRLADISQHSAEYQLVKRKQRVPIDNAEQANWIKNGSLRTVLTPSSSVTSNSSHARPGTFISAVNLGMLLSTICSTRQKSSVSPTRTWLGSRRPRRTPSKQLSSLTFTTKPADHKRPFREMFRVATIGSSTP